jgi:hypothetical protein
MTPDNPLPFEIGFSRSPAGRRREPDAPFRLLICGDFSGTSAARPADMAQRKAQRVDVDSFERVYARFAPRVTLSIPGAENPAGYRHAGRLPPRLAGAPGAAVRRAAQPAGRACRPGPLRARGRGTGRGSDGAIGKRSAEPGSRRADVAHRRRRCRRHRTAAGPQTPGRRSRQRCRLGRAGPDPRHRRAAHPPRRRFTPAGADRLGGRRAGATAAPGAARPGVPAARVRLAQCRAADRRGRWRTSRSKSTCSMSPRPNCSTTCARMRKHWANRRPGGCCWAPTPAAATARAGLWSRWMRCSTPAPPTSPCWPRWAASPRAPAQPC